MHRARARRPIQTMRYGVGRPINYAPGRAVVIDSLPPEPLYETIPELGCCGDQYWVPGYWDWDGYSWVWIPGHYEVPPTGFVWVGPVYNNYGTYCEYTPGGWQREDEAPPPPEERPAVVGVSPARRSPPKVQIQTPRPTSIQPNHRPDSVAHPSFEPAPSRTRTVRVNPTVIEPSEVTARPSAHDDDRISARTPPMRPTARPSSPLRDFDDGLEERPTARTLTPAPRTVQPSYAVPPVTRSAPPPVARPDLTPRSSSVPSLTPAPRVQSFSPSDRPVTNTPAFTPAPRSQSFTPSKSFAPAPRSQSFAPAPTPAKPAIKPQQSNNDTPVKAAGPAIKAVKK